MLKIGLLIDEGELPKEVYDLIVRSQNTTKYTISSIIVSQNKNKNKKTRFSKALNYLKNKGLMKFITLVLWTSITKLDKRFTKQNHRSLQSSEKSNGIQVNIPYLYITPDISKNGLVDRFSAEDITLIKKEKFDVLIRFGMRILRGDILQSSKYGIISFHHGNNNMMRGSPTGIWEVLNRYKSTGFIIQRLKEELDGGDILFRGKIKTSSSIFINAERLQKKSNVFLHKILEKIDDKDDLPDFLPNQPYSYPLHKLPNISTQIKYLCFLLIPFIFSRMINKILFRKEKRWGIAYQFVDNWRKAVFWKSKKIKNPLNHSLSNPFLWNEAGKSYCFVTDFNKIENKRSISAYELNPQSSLRIGTVLEENCNLSFPFLFEENKNVYMCPETSEKGEIRLYKLKNFPDKWSFHKTIMTDVKAFNSMLFKHDNKWWLFSNIDSSELGDCTAELHIFYSDNLDSDQWIPHTQNPVIFDSEKSKNSGLIIEGKDIYRVFQSQNFGFEGDSSGIAKITNLTESTYTEEIVSKIVPKFFKHIDSTNALAFNKGIVAIDFSNYEKF